MVDKKKEEMRLSGKLIKPSVDITPLSDTIVSPIIASAHKNNNFTTVKPDKQGSFLPAIGSGLTQIKEEKNDATNTASVDQLKQMIEKLTSNQMNLHSRFAD